MVVLQSRHRIGHEKTDGVDGLLIDHTFLAEIHHHRGSRLFVIIHNQPSLGHHDHDASAFHSGNHGDTAAELAFDSALLVHLLHEIRHTDGIFLIK